LYAFVLSTEFVEKMSDLVRGALYPAVTDKQVREQLIPIPPFPEQQRIAALLTEQMAAVERARRAAKEQIEATRSLIIAYFQQEFRDILPLAVGNQHDAAPSGWRWELLTDVARLESGHTPSRYHPEWWGGDIPWLALPDIRALNGRIAYETSEYTNQAGIANSSARILPAGTVALSRTASVGFVTIMGQPMATSQDFVNWVCGPELDLTFLALLLRTSRDFILAQASGAVHKTVYMPTLKAFQVCIPPIKEQQSIGAFLTQKLATIEQTVGVLEEQLGAINHLPAALLHQAFKGAL